MIREQDIKRLKDPDVARAISSFVPEQVFERVIRNPNMLDRVGERRTVTVMFVDIAGFTPFCEGRDAEEVMELLNRLFETVLEPVSRYGGTVDKFMGDAAIILFGAPVAHEDDPLRALAASLEILDRGADFSGIAISIGVNTGEVVAGIVGNDHHREYTVIGDVVNTASRLQGCADSREILVGGETHRECRFEFEFGTRRELELKGKSSTTSSWPLIGKIKEISRKKLPELVGRKREFKRLENILNIPGESAFISGEAGIGKTALVDQIVETAGSAHFRIVDFSALPWGENLPYAPVQGVITGILGDDPVKGLGTILPEKLELAPLLSGFYSVEIPPTEKTLFLSTLEKAGMLRRLIHEIIRTDCGNKKLLVVADNLENLDSSTAGLIELFSLDEFTNIIVSGRNDGPMEEITAARIRLGPFGKGKSAELVRKTLGTDRIGADLIDEIVSETGGNPGYIVALCRLLESRNGVALESGVLRLSGKVVENLPRDIEGIYTARLDSLPPDARETIRVASVLGQDFRSDLLTGIIEDPIVEKGIRFLCREGFLVPRESLFRFTSHPMLKAAYNSLLHSAKKRLHLQAGNAIEAMFRSGLRGHFEELARHFQSGGDFKKAFHYQTLSGRKQEERFANREALFFYEGALEIEDDRAIEWGMWKELFGAMDSAGRLYWYSGELERVIELNIRAKRLAEKMGDKALLTDAVNRIALAKQELGYFEEARKLYEAQLTILGELPGEAERLLQAMVNLGTLLSDMGELSEAKALYERGLKIAEGKAGSKGAANLLGNLGWLEGQRGNWESAVEYLDRAGEIDRELGNLRGQAVNAVNLAQAHRAGDEKKRESQSYELALEIFRRIGDRRGEALCLSNLGDTARETGNIESARGLHRKALKLAKELDDRMRIVDAELGLAMDSFEERDLGSASRRAQRALAIARDSGDWEGEIEVGIVLLEILADAGRGKAYAKLWRELKKIILDNNPSAISRIEGIPAGMKSQFEISN